MNIHHTISARWSPVAFSDKKIDQEIIDSLFEAARWAPSSFNAQPWKFIYGAKGDETYDKLFALISDGNKKWAQTAPLLILGIAETVPEGRKSMNRFAFHDTGMAVSNLLVQATASELFVHQMGGYDNEMAPEVFDLPETWEPASMMAVGYKGDASVLDPDIAAREDKERTRKPLKEIVFNGKPV